MSVGTTATPTLPPRGVYVPLLSFFKGEDGGELDHNAAQRQIER